MSAPEAIAKVDSAINTLKIAHTGHVGVLRNVQEAIASVASLQSDSMDATIALQGLRQLEESVEQDINVLIESIEDLTNYRQVL